MQNSFTNRRWGPGDAGWSVGVVPELMLMMILMLAGGLSGTVPWGSLMISVHGSRRGARLLLPLNGRAGSGRQQNNGCA